MAWANGGKGDRVGSAVVIWSLLAELAPGGKEEALRGKTPWDSEFPGSTAPWRPRDDRFILTNLARSW